MGLSSEEASPPTKSECNVCSSFRNEERGHRRETMNLEIDQSDGRRCKLPSTTQGVDRFYRVR